MKVLKIEDHKDKKRIMADVLFWTTFTNEKGAQCRIDLLKNSKTGEIAFGFTENYNAEEPDKHTHVDDTLIVCEDSDNYISNKFMKFFKGGNTV